MISSVTAKDGTGTGFQVFPNEKMAINCQYHPLSNNVYVTTNSPDNVYVLDGTKIETAPIARIAMQVTRCSASLVWYCGAEARICAVVLAR